MPTKVLSDLRVSCFLRKNERWWRWKRSVDLVEHCDSWLRFDHRHSLYQRSGCCVRYMRSQLCRTNGVSDMLIPGCVDLCQFSQGLDHFEVLWTESFFKYCQCTLIERLCAAILTLCHVEPPQFSQAMSHIWMLQSHLLPD